MAEMMKAAVLYAKDDIRYEDYPMPEIQNPGDVKVRVRAAGICGSDVPRVLGDTAWFYPIVLGHEFCGEVVEVGKDVSSLQVGDYVSCAALVPCYKCEDCQKGNYGSCRNYGFVGTRQQGGFSDYVVADEKNFVKYDASVSYDQALLFEPCTVGIHGVRAAEYKGGGTVAILGCGTVGIFTAQWAKILGGRKVVVFDIEQSRLDLALRMGADAVVNSKDEDWKARGMELTGGYGFDYVFETAGTGATMEMAFQLTGTKGTLCMIGYPGKPVTFDPNVWHQINMREFKVVGSQMSYAPPFPGPDWTLTSHYFSTGEMKYDPSMIFKKFEMKDVVKAFDLFRTPGAVKGKVMLVNDLPLD